MCIGSCYYTKNRYGVIDVDDRDREIIAECEAALNARDGIRVGDFIYFADGVGKRVGILEKGQDGTPWLIQPTSGGSFHLGKYGVSCSGGMDTPVPWESLTQRGPDSGSDYGTMYGDVWIFHHNDAGAGHGAYTSIKFRVFDCSLPSTHRS